MTVFHLVGRDHRSPCCVILEDSALMSKRGVQLGCDILGWIEVRLVTHWYGTIWISPLVGRNYQAFDCLFGVRGSMFRPVAARRGFPADVSPEVKWAASGLDYDEALAFTNVEIQEGLPLGWHSPTWITLPEVKAIDPRERALEPPPPRSLRHQGVGELPTRRDVLDRSWQRLFHQMDFLAEDFGEQGVRLVVWFAD